MSFTMWRRPLLHRARSTIAATTARTTTWQSRVRWRVAAGTAALHTSRPAFAVKPFLLADIGEGIRECEIIQWFVQPGAKVQQFDNICEVQSDKASVEISSRYDGVIKKLYYEAGDMAIVGKPLVDIDMSEMPEDAEGAPSMPSPEASSAPAAVADAPPPPVPAASSQARADTRAGNSGRHTSLATPAVRRMVREWGLDITQIVGTGKDGRVLKEDVTRHVEGAAEPPSAGPTSTAAAAAPLQEETVVPLTPVQNQMFKTMTKSLSIPHFLYADEAAIDRLVTLRNTINHSLAVPTNPASPPPVRKISYMPFFIKAVSTALHDFPIINSRLDFADETKPRLVMRPQHNIGVAMDTPAGLLVPNIKNVQQLSIMEIAAELARLQTAGAAGKLGAADLKGGTITLSNIGNVGGTYVAPVIVTSEVAIMGIGRTKVVPAFDKHGAVVPKTVVNFSWSADHRIVDGGTMARMASLVKRYCEEPELLVSKLR
ncbi:hypothetical protein Dda_5101 [Drechslerella dactyloides]|uniref:Dihydrolipoamide acetyltransferase component of pyruvate dehydrogenase complex n=1 Tax=Drechslerella dactyloides TaxID=74499 RepID=A0AAD6NIE3_DREDA|nr:hypothetical protein Dda_5101 [Drechslerella dactyloides]